MVMTLPIMFPVMKEAGFDPIWLGVVSVKLAEIGVLTPPVYGYFDPPWTPERMSEEAKLELNMF